MTTYETVIGLEVHVQAKSASKMFCACPNRFGAEPNTLVCPVCMGYPGVLPVANRGAILTAVRAGLLTGCRIARHSKFDRKSYFYPDMAKNYQISQQDMPFCVTGRVQIDGVGFSGKPLPDKEIRIHRIHLEEDVAKLTHFKNASGVDFNRCGVPLLETVSEPDMRSADEAYAYLANLKEIMQYGGISDCDMEKGQMRCDVNISIRPFGQKEFGTKIEIKNLNSFRSAHRAIEFEEIRQREIIEAGGVIRQETRGWDDEAGATYLMRTKEEAHDYRYFPDPDLMPVVFTDAEIAELEAALPELPRAKRRRFVADYALTEYDAAVLTQDRRLADYFDATARLVKTPKLAANWIISDLLRELSERGTAVADCPVAPEALAKLIGLVETGVISGKIAKEVLPELFDGADPEAVVRAKGLVQVSDAGAIRQFAEQAVAANPTQVEQYRAGNPKVLQFLVGQTMKLSKGKANPQLVSQLLEELLK